MDALGAYALSCATYFAIRYFSAERGATPGPAARGLLFALCFLPVLAYSAMILLGLDRSRIDLYRKLDVFLSWTAAAVFALPAILHPRSHSKVGSATARGTLAAWGLVAASSLCGSLFDLPGILPATLYALLFAGALLAALLAPRRALESAARFAAPDFGASNLSAREAEVVSLMIRGKTNQEIADELFISLSTVKSHVASVFSKTGARNRVEVARLFGESGPLKG
jgi:Response regulator containing a CheY-like receiver domain and an HTH DNA-binding domain